MAEGIRPCLPIAKGKFLVLNQDAGSHLPYTVLGLRLARVALLEKRYPNREAGLGLSLPAVTPTFRESRSP